MAINTVSQLVDELREYDEVGPLAVMLAVIDADRGMHLESLRSTRTTSATARSWSCWGRHGEA